MPAELTWGDVEKFVVDEGNPEEMIVSKENWSVIFKLKQATNRDGAGVYMTIVGTKLRCKGSVSLDVSDRDIVAEILAAKQ